LAPTLGEIHRARVSGAWDQTARVTGSWSKTAEVSGGWSLGA
jgi:hypothetical protein